jgi:mRNA interferase MazF
MVLNRGDICLVDFNPAKGGEMGKLRPAVIMSDSKMNNFFTTVIVVPLSSLLVDDAKPYRYRVEARGELERSSDACVYEIRALAKKRVKKKLGALESEELKALQHALCRIIQ